MVWFQQICMWNKIMFFKFLLKTLPCIQYNPWLNFNSSLLCLTLSTQSICQTLNKIKKPATICSPTICYNFFIFYFISPLPSASTILSVTYLTAEVFKKRINGFSFNLVNQEWEFNFFLTGKKPFFQKILSWGLECD